MSLPGVSMADKAILWNGDEMGQEKMALVTFSRPPQEGSSKSVPLFAAASTGAMTVLLLPNDFGSFLRRHQYITIVCYDAAALHWLLEGQFKQTSDTQSLKILWAYSAEPRMIDIMLLDQHVRRCKLDVDTVASPLDRLLRRRAEMEFPDDQEIQRRVAAAWQEMASSGTLDDSVLELVSAISSGILRVHDQLMAEATRIVAAAEQANQLPEVSLQLPDAEEKEMQAQFKKLIKNLPLPRSNTTDGTAKPEDVDLDEAEESTLAQSRQYGPLGVGIDVQGAIALGKPDRPLLQVDAQQSDELCYENERRFQVASRQLHDDPEARPCFHWSDENNHARLVARDDNGLPLYHVHALKVWLRAVAGKLCDINHLPVSVPLTQRGDPSFDPESWGIWAACNRSLRAWRDLVRAARFNHHLASVAPCQPVYSVVPIFRAQKPDLAALRSLRLPIFQPRDGHVFVVGTFPLLKIYCLAAIHQQGDLVPRGRLIGHFLENHDPIGEIASELYARMTTATSEAEATAGREASHADLTPCEVSSTEGKSKEVEAAAILSPVRKAVDEFAELKERDPDAYFSWRWITQILPRSNSNGVANESYECAFGGGIRSNRRQER